MTQESFFRAIGRAKAPLVLIGALFLESIAPPYSGASVVRVTTSGCPSPMNRMVDYHTVYTCLEPHHSLGVSKDLYKLTSRLRLVAKPLSLELRASTLVLELEWVYQSSGQPRESQWMSYSPLNRPQPPNLAIGKGRRKLHSSDDPTL